MTYYITVAREVRQEEKWLEQTFKGWPEQQKTLVTEALLDNWNVFTNAPVLLSLHTTR